MKQTIAIILLAIAMCFADNVFSQTVTRDASGNYFAVKKQTVATVGKPTGNTFTDTKGIVYPLYESERGKLYYTRTSKAGNTYKVYIKQ